MVYIKLEQNMDNFMVKYKSLPKVMKKISFKSRCRNGKFKMEKCGNSDYIILPELNDMVLKKIRNVAKIKCWKNICVSDNLRENDNFKRFADENNLKIMDGKWLIKNMVDQVMEYVVQMKNEMMVNQEISILCNKLDDTVIEKIKEISQKVKICNILTNNMKQYQKLETELYQTNGIVLNISNNYKKAVAKSGVIINFDFLGKDFEKCVLAKNSYIISVCGNVEEDKKEFEGRNIVLCEINMPEKYLEYAKILEGFNKTILYESFIYKTTNCKNIKKELIRDGVQVLSLQDSNGKMVKNEKVNFAKTLDKISI